jgi:type IV pilus assembly protein PilC
MAGIFFFSMNLNIGQLAIDIKSLQKKVKTSKPPDSKGFNVLELLNKDISFSSGFDDKKKETMYSKMNILLSAGVDIKTVLDLVEGDQPKTKDKELIRNIRASVLEGRSLSQAFLASKKFSPFEYYSIQIGEETGRLNQVLVDLSLYFHNKIAQKRKFISAVSYPLGVLFTEFGAVFFMMRFLVPLFADVYKRFGGELPFVTKLVLDISSFVTKTGGWVILSILFVAFILYRQKDQLWFRNIYSKVLLRIPVFGGIMKKIYLSRFCNSMALLIGANIPLTEALRMLKQMIAFYPMEMTIDPIRESIFQGGSLHQSMEVHSIYPRDLVSLIKVGEEVNGLDKMFERLSKQYTDDVTHQTEILNSLLEPILIVFIGIIIGFILIAMYLPIFKLSTQMM